jgi:hypothetical protein
MLLRGVKRTGHDNSGFSRPDGGLPPVLSCFRHEHSAQTLENLPPGLFASRTPGTRQWEWENPADLNLCRSMFIGRTRRQLCASLSVAATSVSPKNSPSQFVIK